MPRNIEFTDRKHTPYNKRVGECDRGFCQLSVGDYDGSKSSPQPWTSITLAESYTVRDGSRSVDRTISMTLTPEQRAGLIGFLCADAGVPTELVEWIRKVADTNQVSDRTNGELRRTLRRIVDKIDETVDPTPEQKFAKSIREKIRQDGDPHLAAVADLSDDQINRLRDLTQP